MGWRGGVRSDDGAHDTHDTVQADGDAIAGAAMGGRQDFGGVGVEAAVVDVLLWDVSTSS
jgi:hypothetical protein